MSTVFLHSELSASERDPATAKFNVIPMPLERTVSYGSGTASGPSAILAASNELERLCAGQEPCIAGICTQSAVDCTGDLPLVMQRLADQTHDAVLANQIPVTLGGEHSLSYGAVSGIIKALNCKPTELGIIQIDAHADLRCAYQNEVHSHASVMHLLASDGVQIAQFGVRALCREEQLSRTSNNVFFVDAEELVVNNIQQIDLPNDFPKNVYISFDLDGLDPAVMPATGTPVPGGLSFYQSINLVAHAIKSRRVVGMDVVELAPIPNQPGWDFTAAQLVYRLMGLALN